MDAATATNGLTALADDARLVFGAALEAVNPRRAVERALAYATVPDEARVWLIATGKAAPAMAAGAVASLAAAGREPAGGLVIAPQRDDPPHPSLQAAPGDHPLPGARSAAAAAALGELVRQVAPTDVVWVLLSGGTSSLIGAPAGELPPTSLAALTELLLGSGMLIGDMNRVRRRLSRWGGGKLARALEPAVTRVLAVSDVPGDDPAAIGSGPCAPDESSLDELRGLLRAAGVWDRCPSPVRAALEHPPADGSLDGVPAGDPAFRHLTTDIVASNDLAVRAALARARTLGYSAERARTPLAGRAADAGRALAREMMADRRGVGTMRCLVAGGETTVRLEGAAPDAHGGRCQELALAAAEVLAGAARPLVMLAAGTDGRDGPTDAAGAIVHGDTWTLAVRAGRDPARDLAAHDAGRALDAAGALLRTGPTGTNVMDLAILLAR